MNKEILSKTQPQLFGGRCQIDGSVENAHKRCQGSEMCVFSVKPPSNKYCEDTRKAARVCYSCSKDEACWSQWSSWGKCSLNCGSGVRTRQRVCVRLGRNLCEGKKLDTETCNPIPCGCPENSPCECLVFENAAGKTLLKYDCSNQGITSVKKIPIWKEAEYLDLSINKIWNTADVGYMLRSMPDLKRIDLDKNYIEALPPALFEYNTKLQFVNFLNNRLNGIPENLFKNNPLLEVVWFSGNKVRTSFFYRLVIILVRS
jgi:hypothetical protein